MKRNKNKEIEDWKKKLETLEEEKDEIENEKKFHVEKSKKAAAHKVNQVNSQIENILRDLEIEQSKNEKLENENSLYRKDLKMLQICKDENHDLKSNLSDCSKQLEIWKNKFTKIEMKEIESSSHVN